MKRVEAFRSLRVVTRFRDEWPMTSLVMVRLLCVVLCFAGLATAQEPPPLEPPDLGPPRAGASGPAGDNVKAGQPEADRPDAAPSHPGGKLTPRIGTNAGDPRRDRTDGSPSASTRKSPTKRNLALLVSDRKPTCSVGGAGHSAALSSEWDSASRGVVGTVTA